MAVEETSPLLRQCAYGGRGSLRVCVWIVRRHPYAGYSMKFSCFVCQFLLSMSSATWLILFEENRRGEERPVLKYAVVFHLPEIYNVEN
jgi:hypothetical protein